MHVLLVLALLAPAVRQDSVRVSASLKIDRIVAGETAVLEIRVETSGVVPDAIRMPDLPAGLEIVGQSDVTYDQINFPGGRSRLTSRSILLTSRVPGTFMVPGVSIVVGGRTYRTRPVPLIVSTAPRTRAPPNIAEGVELNAHVQPTRAWVGQQITFAAEAVFPRELRQRQTRPATYQAPNPSGFWAQDLADQLVIGLKSVGDEIYETQTFKRAYFPITPGSHQFPPAKLSFEYRPGAGLPPESREVASAPVRLVVMPLPASGRPESFTGAVGQFRLRASVEPLRAEVGEAVSLVVEVIGRGNIKALPAPRLPAVESIEVFPPTEDAEPQIGNDAVTGTKRFSWVLVPRKAGEVEIPPIRYAFFDPSTERYEEATAPPMRLEVSGESPLGPGRIRLQPVKPSPSSATLDFVRNPWFLAAQLLPLAFLLLAWRTGRLSEPGEAKRKTPSAKHLLAQLQHAAIGEPRAFSHQLATAIRTHIADFCDDPQLRNASPAALRRAVESAGTPRPAAAALAELLSALDRARFAKDESAPDPKAALKRAEQLLDAVHTGRARSAAGRTAMLILLSMGVYSAAGAATVERQGIGAPSVTALSAQSGAFHRGVQMMLRQRFTDAASEFDQYLSTNPRDANGWYNAGNALFNAGQPGEAVRAWIRAVRLIPRHTAARRNLEAVAPAALALLPPGFALSMTEAGILLALLWWVLAIHTGWLLRKRKQPGLPAAMIGVAAALVTFGGLASRSTTAIAITRAATPVLADPVIKAEPVEELRAAMPVEIMARRPGWLRVRTPDGREGWIEAISLAEI